MTRREILKFKQNVHKMWAGHAILICPSSCCLGAELGRKGAAVELTEIFELIAGEKDTYSIEDLHQILVFVDKLLKNEPLK